MTKIDGPRRTSCCFPVPVRQGQGWFTYPATLKHSILESYIRVHNVKNSAPLTASKCFFIHCNAAFFRDKDKQCKENVLQVFESSKKFTSFRNLIDVPLEITPDHLQMCVKEWKNGQYHIVSDFDGLLLVELFGFRTSEVV